MSDTLGSLMESNLLEVFGQRDSARRTAAMAELYTEECTFFEAEEQVNAREALNAKVGSILEDAPRFVFRAAGPAQVNHDLGRLRWQFGPAGARRLWGRTHQGRTTAQRDPAPAARSGPLPRLQSCAAWRTIDVHDGHAGGHRGRPDRRCGSRT
jgi:hypothetical protein